jgi:hypothetical protein
VGGDIVRQPRTSKQGRVVSLLAACAVGYVTGAWHVTALRGAGNGSAAETVALRFPHEWSVAGPAITLAAMRGLRPDTDLLSPVPMVPEAQSQSAAEEPGSEQPATASSEAGLAKTLVRTASLEVPAATAEEAPAQPMSHAAAKPVATVNRPLTTNRPGYVLDDAQIANIKQRLHLTPDQERMWPAVEAALRNMAYKRTQQAAARGTARNAQAAAVDPAAVDSLKSAAVPLIMSFSAEQKDEVRGLAHVMGLDQLAAQF